MATDQITICVDSETADAYRAVSESQRRKLDLLLSLRLQEALRPGESLESVMRDISRSARERGLTPEILDSMLREP